MSPKPSHERILINLADRPDSELDPALAALALEADQPPELQGTSASYQLAALRGALAGTADTVPQEVGEGLLYWRADRLADVVMGQFAFQCIDEENDSPEAVKLSKVIENRAGLPVSLGLIYMHLARSQGWALEGLSFPGIFLLRLSEGSRRLIVDPADGCHPLEIHHLRDILKVVEGAHAELKPQHYQSLTTRETLLRLQNLHKVRLLREDDLEEALKVVERSMLFAPGHPDAWYEAGLIKFRLGRVQEAIEDFEIYRQVCAEENRPRISTLLSQLKAQAASNP